MISAKDINNKKFEQARPGYKPEEVDEFLRELALQITQMQKDKDEIEKKIEVLVERVREYKSDEDALKDALIGAQKQSKAVVAEAQEKANAIIAEAEEKAKKVVAEASLKADEIIGNTRVQYEKEKHCLAKMQNEVSEFKANLLAMYKAHLGQITAIPDFDDEDEEEEEVPVQASPTVSSVPAQAASETHTAPVQEMPELKTEASSVSASPTLNAIDETKPAEENAFSDKMSQAFIFGETKSSPSAMESKFGNLKFGQNK